MSESSRDAKDAWVSRVLGVNRSYGGSGPNELSAAPTNDGTAPAVGLVAYRKALLGFRSAVAQANGQLRSFAELLAENLPAEADLAERVAEAVNAECERLNDQIDNGIGAPADERGAENEKIQSAIAGLIARVNSNKLIEHVDSNPLVPLNVAVTLSGALARVAQTVA